MNESRPSEKLSNYLRLRLLKLSFLFDVEILCYGPWGSAKMYRSTGKKKYIYKR